MTARSPISPEVVADLRAKDPEYGVRRQSRVPEIDRSAARLVAARWAAQRHAEIEQQQREMEDLIVRCCVGFCIDCDRPMTTPVLRRLHPESVRYGVMRRHGFGRCSTCYDRNRTSATAAAPPPLPLCAVHPEVEPRAAAVPVDPQQLPLFDLPEEKS